MNEQPDLELLRVRLRFIDLIKSFFFDEPDSEKMGRWRGTFSALSQEQISPRFDKATAELSTFLFSKSLQMLQEEYYVLFVDPVDGEQVDLTASVQLNGRAYSQPLIEVKSLMQQAGVQKNRGVTEPEDSLLVLLDFLSSLIDEEKKDRSSEAHAIQQRLLDDYLHPLAEKISNTLQENDKAQFYALCATFLCSYLDLEKDLISRR